VIRDPRVGDLLAVDPSKTSPGAALFRNGRLFACRRVRIGCLECGVLDYKHTRECSRPEEGEGSRVLRVARRIVEWVIDVPAEPRVLVYEWPKVYAVGKSDGDPADLIPLAGIGGALSGILAMAQAHRNVVLDVRTYEPAEWAGQVKKSKKAGEALTSPRGRRISERLNEDEREIVTPQHDVVDAIGLGMHALGRGFIGDGQRRVYPGAV
jgi:hypothetical protein